MTSSLLTLLLKPFNVSTHTDVHNSDFSDVDMADIVSGMDLLPVHATGTVIINSSGHVYDNVEYRTSIS
jgi:hypothetical protein